MRTLPQNINLHYAKTHLSQIIDEVMLHGKPVIIAKAGKPQVKIIPLQKITAKKRFGFMKTQAVEIPEHFDEMFSAEISEMFGGKNENSA